MEVHTRTNEIRMQSNSSLKRPTDRPATIKSHYQTAKPQSHHRYQIAPVKEPASTTRKASGLKPIVHEFCRTAHSSPQAAHLAHSREMALACP